MSELDRAEEILEAACVALRPLEDLDPDLLPAPVLRALRASLDYASTGLGLAEMLRDGDLDLPAPPPADRGRPTFVTPTGADPPFPISTIRVRDSTYYLLDLPADDPRPRPSLALSRMGVLALHEAAQRLAYRLVADVEAEGAAG